MATTRPPPNFSLFFFLEKLRIVKKRRRRGGRNWVERHFYSVYNDVFFEAFSKRKGVAFRGKRHECTTHRTRRIWEKICLVTLRGCEISLHYVIGVSSKRVWSVAMKPFRSNGTTPRVEEMVHAIFHFSYEGREIFTMIHDMRIWIRKKAWTLYTSTCFIYLWIDHVLGWQLSNCGFHS